MRVYRANILMLVLSAGICIPIGSSAQQEAYTELTDLYRAPIIISYDPAVIPLTPPVVDAVLGSEQFSQRLAAAVKDIPPRMMLRFNPLGEGRSPGQLAGSLRITAADVEADAMKGKPHQLWQAVVEELENVLSETAKRLERQQEERWSLQRELLENKRDHMKGQFEEWLELAALFRTVDTGDELEQLSSKRHEVSFQLAGIEARRQAVQDRAKELQNSGATAELDREIIGQLEQIVSFQEHQHQLKRQAYKTNHVSQLEVAQSQAELAKARIELLRAKKETAAKSSHELAALSEELSQATIAAAEQRAILQAIESRIEELKQALEEQTKRMRAAQEAEHRAALLREQLATIENRLAAMELERFERAAARGGRVTIVPWSTPPAED